MSHDVASSQPEEVPRSLYRGRNLFILLLVTVSLTGFGIVAWRGGTPTIVSLPSGASMKLIGICHGERVLPKDVGEASVTDMDGCQWRHYLLPEPTWRQKLHEAAPSFLRKHLPESWAPPPKTFSMTTGNPTVLMWQVTGVFDIENWRITWVDENDFESIGNAAQIRLPVDTSLAATAAVPPARSRNLILRSRHLVKDKPVSEWPLIAELPMRNPAPVRTTEPAVDTLPATRTQDDIAVTLKSVTVDRSAVGTRRAVEVAWISRRQWTSMRGNPPCASLI